ncbi:hypothetical protein BC835DRAFT_1275093 [Cytidiella melzeri]|nr:hypothetical protein BC835DRAFT_1275093 [Cytidiella melzeri]
MPPTHISVLGGGLTGLSSAFHLSRRYPSAKITLLEKSPRLGGWVHSERVDVNDGHGHTARILLERGPRTLRPNGKSTLELVNLLNLQQSLITIPNSAEAARTRFLHIPGTKGLTALPSSALSAFASPLGRRLARAVAFEPFKRPHKGSSIHDLEDDNLENFLAVRLGPELARLVGSALVHGIYAADSRQLSVRAAFPSLWDAARRGNGSIARGMMKASSEPADKFKEDYELGGVLELMQGVSVYSFRDGMVALTSAMESALRRSPNVEVVKNDGAVMLDKNTRDATITVHSQLGTQTTSSHVVSAMPLSQLKSLLQRSSLPMPPHLDANPLSSVTVVNLIFPPTIDPIHPAGFGYLIPRDANGRVEVLGTVFDSCSLGAQDEYPSHTSPRFTKMTMMIRSAASSPPTTLERVLKHLENHLQRQTPLPVPVFFRANTMHECIPTPTVGHTCRTEEMKRVVREEWGGRLEVVGAGVGGVSVADCIEQGRHAGRGWL